MFFSGETGTQGKQYLCASYVRLSQDDGDKEESNSIVNQKNLMCAASPNRFLHWEKINAVQSFLICYSFFMCQINIHVLAHAQSVNHLVHIQFPRCSSLIRKISQNAS